MRAQCAYSLNYIVFVGRSILKPITKHFTSFTKITCGFNGDDDTTLLSIHFTFSYIKHNTMLLCIIIFAETLMAVDKPIEWENYQNDIKSLTKRSHYKIENGKTKNKYGQIKRQKDKIQTKIYQLETKFIFIFKQKQKLKKELLFIIQLDVQCSLIDYLWRNKKFYRKSP